MSHPSNDIASNVDLYFAAGTVEDEVKQGKLDSLSEEYKNLVNKVIVDVCDCEDRATALRRLRESYDLAVSSIINEPAKTSSWPDPASFMP